MTIFQTNAWQQAWWAYWGDTQGFRRISNRSGLAGLYVDRYRFRGILPIHCLQFVGTNYRRLATPRTEYNRLTSGAAGAECLAEVRRRLGAGRWSEAVFRDVPASAPDLQALQDYAAQTRCMLRTVAEDTSYFVDTTQSFEAYLKNLGSGTRLRLYNRRSVLQTQGEITFANAWPDKVDGFFEALNGFHESRWGGPCFGTTSLAFHRTFLDTIGEEGGEPRLSVLYCNDQIVSVLYNVLYRGCIYNLQAGFVENFHRKLALGSLHLGYDIEGAFADKDIHKFDFLAGSGKNENYKSRIATGHEKLVSVMLVRHPVLKLLYALKD
ncbi:GNAT family N-acetyltransferase [Marinobacter sp. X15-166B]|uniref:GNAT family N-acetyltransferase n=1 Tax=Marinobacter sp. X15-166B TaxID=1897620 RepID=UPI00085C588B|nr:GNAT family N-acetyltransferase [Marinobacter sp. X15-166B]OEY67743.1 hypothetical protein BG841_15775 [Marinobacter sp. X15-166B]